MTGPGEAPQLADDLEAVARGLLTDHKASFDACMKAAALLRSAGGHRATAEKCAEIADHWARQFALGPDRQSVETVAERIRAYAATLPEAPQPASSASLPGTRCPCTPADRVECHNTPETRRPSNCVLRTPPPATARSEPTEWQVEVAARQLATSPLIDAPKLPFPAWMGLARSMLKSAFAAAPLSETATDDTARLDFMERYLCRAGEVKNDAGQTVKLARVWSIMGELETLRETVDALMAAPSPDGNSREGGGNAV